jgi:hypothetical protein
MYALGPIPPEDEIRESVLANHPHFEAKLAAGTRDLPMNRFVTITYESLVANPVAVIERLYQQLEMGEFGTAGEAIVAETQRRSGYQAKDVLLSHQWQQRISDAWGPILTSYAALK